MNSKPFMDEATTLLETMHAELTHQGKFPVIHAERFNDETEELVLAWVSDAVHSSFVIDPDTGAGYFISHSPAGELADIDFASVDAMRRVYPVIITLAVGGTLSLLSEYSELLGLRPETAPVLTVTDENNAKLEWEHEGILTSVEYSVSPKYASITAYRAGESIAHHRCLHPSDREQQTLAQVMGYVNPFARIVLEAKRTIEAASVETSFLYQEEEDDEVVLSFTQQAGTFTLIAVDALRGVWAKVTHSKDGHLLQSWVFTDPEEFEDFLPGFLNENLPKSTTATTTP